MCTRSKIVVTRFVENAIRRCCKHVYNHESSRCSSAHSLSTSGTFFQTRTSHSTIPHCPSRRSSLRTHTSAKRTNTHATYSHIRRKRCMIVHFGSCYVVSSTSYELALAVLLLSHSVDVVCAIVNYSSVFCESVGVSSCCVRCYFVLVLNVVYLFVISFAFGDSATSSSFSLFIKMFCTMFKMADFFVNAVVFGYLLANRRRELCFCSGEREFSV